MTGRSLAEKVPFILISLLVGAATVAAQLSAGAVRSGAGHHLWHAPFVAAAGLLFYLGKTVLPVRLTTLYPWPWDAAGSLPALFLVSPVVAGVLVAAVLPALRRSRCIAFGVLFFVVTLLPVLQVIPIGHAFAADRYAYLPTVGLFLLAGEGAARLLVREPRRALRGAAAWLAALTLLSTLLVWQTRRQTRIWKDSVALWSDVVEKQPRAFEGWVNLSVAHGAADVPLELRILEQTIEMFPGHPELHRAHRNIGSVLMDIGHPGQAVEAYRDALTLKPDFVPALEGLGSALMALGRADEARSAFERAIAVEPGSVKALVNLGIVLSEAGDVAGAIERYRQALEIDTASVEARHNLGVDLAALGKEEEARREFLEVLRVRPGFSPARIELEKLDAAAREARP